MCINSHLKMIENCDCLFLISVGEFKESTVKKLFSKYLKNVIHAKNIEEALDLANKNHIDILLCDDTNKIDSFECFKQIKQVNEKVLTFLATNRLDTDKLLKSIELKIDGYLLEYSPIDKLLTQINHPISNYVNSKNNTFYQNYFDNTSRSIIISKTDSEGIITYVNEKFCKISGYSDEEIIGKSHNIIRHPDNDKRIFEELWNTIKVKKTMWE